MENIILTCVFVSFNFAIRFRFYCETQFNTKLDFFFSFGSFKEYPWVNKEPKVFYIHIFIQWPKSLDIRTGGTKKALYNGPRTLSLKEPNACFAASAKRTEGRSTQGEQSTV